MVGVTDIAVYITSGYCVYLCMRMAGGVFFDMTSHGTHLQLHVRAGFLLRYINFQNPKYIRKRLIKLYGETLDTNTYNILSGTPHHHHFVMYERVRCWEE